MQRKKERKRARDMDRDHTFDLPDLTEDFWKTVVFVQEDPPSGMGGPGCVCLLSKEGKEYIFGFEETPFYKCDELFPIFETTDERIGYRHKYKAEEHGWKYLEQEKALIREDILDEYSKAAAEAKREREIPGIFMPSIWLAGQLAWSIWNDMITSEAFCTGKEWIGKWRNAGKNARRRN